MRRVGIAFGLLLGLVVVLPVWAGFSFDASTYAAGEPVSDKGTQGGSWRSEPDLPGGLVNVVADGIGGIDVGEVTRAVFAADAEPEGRAATYDYSFVSDGLTSEPFLAVPEDQLASLTPAQFEDGSTGFYALGDGAWQAVFAAGVVIAENALIECRIETRETDDDRFVSYLVRRDGAWLRLRTRTGRTWFRAGDSSATRRESDFSGPGRVTRIDGREETGPSVREVYWIGGGSGDWNDGGNWSFERDGTAADVIPSPGDVAVLAQTVELTDGESQALVTDLAVAVGPDGERTILGGTVAIDPVIDLSRPRAGKTLAVSAAEGIFDVRADLSCAWWRADAEKNWDSAPFSTDRAFTPSALDYGSWFRVRADNGSGRPVDREFYFSRLPVLYMTTADGETPTASKEEHEGHLFVQGNGEWKSLYDNKMTIKVRGNTTSKYPKKPWKIKLEKKTEMFGIPKSKHWVLLANYNDMAQLRGKLAFDLANAIGSLGMESTWVECVLNGRLQGLYQFAEHIRVDPERVPIYDWEDKAKDYGATETDFSAIDAALAAEPGSIDISGGYLFEFSEEYDEVSKFTTRSGKLQLPTMLGKPEFLNTSEAMMTWCQSFLQDYWDAVTSADRMCKGRHYSEYADVDSMVNYLLVNEFFANADASKKSRYAYIDRGGKLFFGPVWDFDWGCGSVKVSDKVDYWTCSKSAQGETDVIYSFFKEWASDDYFCRRLHKRYWEIRDRYVEVFRDGGLIDQAVPLLEKAGEVDDGLWPRSRTAADDRAIVKDFLVRRIVWLDQQFASPQKLMSSLRTPIQTNQSTWDPDAVRPAEGEVPEIRLEWVREQLEPKDPTYGYATSSRLADAVTAVPTVWGKTTPLWQDYVAGTDPDPSGSNAVLRVTGFSLVDGEPKVEWLPNLGPDRKYTVLGRESLSEGDWHERKPGDCFFKIKVEMP